MRPSRSAFHVAALAVLLVLVRPEGAAAANDERVDPIRPPLHEALAKAAPDELIPVSIVLREQVERAEVARLAEMPAGPARRVAISKRLRETAERTQAPLLVLLRSHEPAGRIARLRPLWIGNIIGVDTTRAVIEELARLDAVDHINYNPKTDVFLGPPACFELAGAGALAGAAAAGNRWTAGTPSSPAAGTDEIECGTSLIRAPEVWSDGDTGAGAIIAMIDTGICWNHPDIKNQIWVNPGEDLDHDGVVMDSDDMNGVDNDGNGFVDDLIGWDFDLNDNNPNDDSNGHGSHTAGTVAGDGTQGTQSGVAPDAHLMAIRVGVTFADEVDVWSGMQYAADNGAHSISMSLGWPHNQNPDRPTWRQNCENTIDMGTAMVIAAGNEGFGAEPDNVRTPGDVPRVITVGATDCSDALASFSSRGPVTWQNVAPFNDWPFPPGLVKPDVSAPGVNTKSHNFCNGYTFLSGTSMATPHTAGAVALMVSNDPSLTNDELKQILEDTSVDLGAPGKDNEFGSGRIDAFVAVDQARKKVRYISHQILDSDPNYGNNDGGLDDGETLSIVLHIKNETPDPVSDVHAIVTTTTPGIRIRTNTATFPNLAPNQEADSLAPQVTFTVDSGCFYDAAFQVELRWNSPDISRKNLSVRVGTSFPSTLFNNDYESSSGPWTAGVSGATDGFFVREDPVGTKDNLNQLANPEDDHTPGSGTRCFVTGNGGPPINSDDVDGGSVTLSTGNLDVHDWETMTFSYYRWFYVNPITFPGGKEFFNAEFSSDGGANWTVLENVITTVNQWTAGSFDMRGRAPFNSNWKFRFVVTDGTTNGDQNVEGGVDDVKVEGTRVLCDSFSEPAHAAPNGIGASLRGAGVGAEVRWSWTAPPVDGTHGAATNYRVWYSATPQGGFSEIASPTGPLWTEVAGMATSSTRFVVVTARNSGGNSPDLP